MRAREAKYRHLEVYTALEDLDDDKPYDPYEATDIRTPVSQNEFNPGRQRFSHLSGTMTIYTPTGSTYKDTISPGHSPRDVAYSTESSSPLLKEATEGTR